MARSGKTVFITALVRSLVAGGRLPFFAAMAEGRITRAYLEPQPDDTLPRFAYEEHLARARRRPAAVAREHAAHQPAARHHRVHADTALRRALGTGRLHIDIVDYPGEWLLDLPLLEISFADGRAGRSRRRAPRIGPAAAKDWLSFLSTLDPDAPADEQEALTGAGLFTRYLQSARAPDPELTAPGPGRFLLPGDLAGSPLLTFFPLPPSGGAAYQRGIARRHAGAPLRELQGARRQAVLPRSLRPPRPADRARRRARRRQRRAGRAADLQRTMEAVLRCFRPGANTWLSASCRAASTGCCSPPPRPTICTTPATTASRRSCG